MTIPIFPVSNFHTSFHFWAAVKSDATFVHIVNSRKFFPLLAKLDYPAGCLTRGTALKMLHHPHPKSTLAEIYKEQDG